jgi:hypothetical protein
LLKVRKHVGDMFFLGFQSTQSKDEFTREEGDLVDDVYKGDNPNARTRPSLLGGAFARGGAHPNVGTRPHTILPLHLTPIRSHFTPPPPPSLHSTSLHFTSSPFTPCASPLPHAHLLMHLRILSWELSPELCNK